MSTMNEKQKVIDINPFDDMELSAQLLAKEVASMLKAEVEELNIFSHIFRSALERSIKRMLWDAKKNMLPINIYPETIPGFSLFLLRKNIVQDGVEENTKEEIKELDKKLSVKETSNPFRSKEKDVVKSVMNTFFERNQGKVIWIEFENIMMMMFPVSDTRDNLKKMELYFTE